MIITVTILGSFAVLILTVIAGGIKDITFNQKQTHTLLLKIHEELEKTNDDVKKNS